MINNFRKERNELFPVKRRARIVPEMLMHAVVEIARQPEKLQRIGNAIELLQIHARRQIQLRQGIVGAVHVKEFRVVPEDHGSPPGSAFR